MKTALIAVDVQPDFFANGPVPVPDGAAVIEPLVRVSKTVDYVVATRDFHPANHSSFKKFGGPWEVHCVAGTAGAQIDPRIDAIADLIVSKGTEVERDAMSGFEGTNLAAMLRAQGVERVIIGGLATDYCVLKTVVGALDAGFQVTVLTDAVRAVDINPGDGQRALEKMRARGVVLTTTAAILSPRSLAG
jgi:nicotinamidase/pyrazinamidase